MKDSDEDDFVFDEAEETHVTLKMDIDKLRRIANLPVRNSQEGEVQQEVTAISTAPKPDASDELPPHVTNYSVPQPEVFVENIEVKQLLDLMGLPYVNAPYEAESQCA